MTTVYVVRKPCECPILRTTDVETAKAAAKPGYILDAITTRTLEAERRALGGATGCGCGEGA